MQQMNIKFIENEEAKILFIKDKLKERKDRGGRSNAAAVRHAIDQAYDILKAE